MDFIRLDNTAVIPYRATVDSAGYDLSSKDNGISQVVPANGKALIALGLKVLFAKGCYGRIAPRSSWSLKNHIDVSGCVTDEEIRVVVFNHGNKDLKILPGQRFAQLIVEECETPLIYEAKTGNEQQTQLQRPTTPSEDNSTRLGFFKLDSTAVLPLRATAESVECDLFSKDNGVSQTVPAHGNALINLGLRVFMPNRGGCYGRIAPLFRLSWESHITVSGGITDKEEIGVILFNHGNTDLTILPGQKIAQLILEKCKTPLVYEAKRPTTPQEDYSERLGFFKLDNTAILPLRATAESVGCDLFSKDNGISQNVPAHGNALINLGLRVFMPNRGGCYGRIAPLFRLSRESHVTVGGGVIDFGYKGEIGVILFNHGNTDLTILPGQKIAQLILEKCKVPPSRELYCKTKVPLVVARGEGGFGSTGNNRLGERQLEAPPNQRSTTATSPPPPEEHIEEEETEDIIIINDEEASEFCGFHSPEEGEIYEDINSPEDERLYEEYTVSKEPVQNNRRRYRHYHKSSTPSCRRRQRRHSYKFRRSSNINKRKKFSRRKKNVGNVRLLL